MTDPALDMQDLALMSPLFSQVVQELQINHQVSSACDSETRGSLERFRQIFEEHAALVLDETEKHWREKVHILLFAARDAVQDSVGFRLFGLRMTGSPFPVQFCCPFQDLHSRLDLWDNRKLNRNLATLLYISLYLYIRTPDCRLKTGR